MSILVVGSVALDTLETPFGRADDALGGSATFISAAASFFASDIRLVGVVGEDFPQDGIDFLRSRGVDLAGLEVVPGGKTFRWSGRYHDDMNGRDTLDTQLNVFADFNPQIPADWRSPDFLALGNIHPALQQQVLGQMAKRPKLVVLDTMNLWIDLTPDELKATMARVDVVIVNDTEARQLTGESNLIRAAKAIRALGPSIVIVKKGEHGALLFTPTAFFSAPAYPLEDLFDPTGAGDTFLGGFIGYLARTGDLSDDNLKRAVVHGSVLASFCVEAFSVERLKTLTEAQVSERVNAFRDLSAFALETLDQAADEA